MNIAIVGTHCTGKTTLIDKFIETFPDWEKISSPTRGAVNFGLKINEEGDSLSQLYMVSSDMKTFVENNGLKDYPNLIFDRCFLDTYIYTADMVGRGQCKKVISQICYEYWDLMKEYFDFIFWVRPEFGLVGDGTRSTEVEFQKKIDTAFEVYFQLYPTPNMVLLSGSTKERLQIINKTINEYNHKTGQ